MAFIRLKKFSYRNFGIESGGVIRNKMNLLSAVQVIIVLKLLKSLSSLTSAFLMCNVALVLSYCVFTGVCSG